MNSSSSALSVQKSAKSENSRSKSCDTVCTSNSSCYLQKRKAMHPLMYSLRPTYTRTSVNSVRQRVMSAKLLKLRSIQNQLNDANYHLSELTKENQTLKNLQKRQDKALSKYENTNADLPRLLHSHEEQMRILTEKNKSQRKILRELNELLKVKEEELVKVQDKLSHLEKLNRDKRLLDREKLVEQIEDLKLKLSKSEEQVTILNRKLMLENKSAKHRLNFEITKHRQCQKELNQALMEIDKLSGLLEKKENIVRPTKNRFSRLAQRQSMSMVTLNGVFGPNRSRSSDEKLSASGSETSVTKTPVTDVKLEPIKCKMDDNPPRKTNDILNVPSENIKNRLSSASTKSRSSDENLFLANGLGFSSGSNHSLSSHSSPLEIQQDENIEKNQTATDSKFIEKLATNLDQAIKKAEDNATNAFDKNLSDYCSQIMGNMTNFSERLEAHKESLNIAKGDTDTLSEVFKKTQLLETRLKNSLGLSDEKEDLVNFLPEELRKPPQNKDKNTNIKQELKVKLEERKKLLATLKAIDNGESIDSVEEVPQNPITYVPEVFSDVIK